MSAEMLLVIGANGQLGTELTAALRQCYGTDRVLATDLRPSPTSDGWFETLDALDEARLRYLVATHRITQVYHLAAVLSAKGEQDYRHAWQLNMDSLLGVLRVAAEHGTRVFWPSSIAAFGPGTPREQTPQRTVMDPNTVYGISKLAGERWCEYFFRKFGVDVRSLRYPGLISYRTPPGGGTTDYAIDIFHQALAHGRYTCFLTADMRLPMMYMADAVRATVALMEAPADDLTVRSSYNVNALSFSPAELAAAIRAHLPDFQIDYAPDFRQQIAATWPAGLDDTAAHLDWGWQPTYDLPTMTRDMLAHLRERVPSSSE